MQVAIDALAAEARARREAEDAAALMTSTVRREDVAAPH
jgi:hypothetical protein